MKDLIRSLLNVLHLDLTKNLEYDRLTKSVLKRVLRAKSNCIDVGCHKGEIMEILLRMSPKGKHFGFEPLPHLYAGLQEKFGNKAVFHDCALADATGKTTFQYVKNAPAYSGIKRRRYDIDNPEIEEIEVELRRLDDLIPADLKIDFLKIDVEGAELGVLKGAKNLLQRWQPVTVFECGLGGSDYYDTTPEEVYDFMTEEAGLQVGTLKEYLKHNRRLTRAAFGEAFRSGKEWYFVGFASE